MSGFWEQYTAMFNRLILDYPDVWPCPGDALPRCRLLYDSPVPHRPRSAFYTTYLLCLGLGLPHRVLGDPLFQGACRGVGLQ